MRFKRSLIISLALVPSAIFSQITIGSAKTPNVGALLDLKQYESTSSGGETAEKGVLLPRVELQDLAKLQMGATSPDLTNEAAKHLGLLVYNVTDNGEICPGLYVWDSAKWLKLDGACSGGGTTPPSIGKSLTLSPDGTLYFASGHNGSIISTQNVLVTWSPVTASLVVTDVNSSFTGTSNSLTTGQTGGNTTLYVTPDAISQASVDANPFVIKQSEIKFGITADGETVNKSLTIQQENKALILDELVREYSSSASSETNKVTTNANFKVSYLPADATNSISNVRLNGTSLAVPSSVTGYERSDGTGNVGNLLYDVTVDASKARYSFLTFSDTQTPKRFLDVSTLILQCVNSSQEPSIDEWAKIAGFTQEEIDKVKTTGTDSRILPNGIQMHRLAKSVRGTNQIFLSSNFGTDPQGNDMRWMIHNLDALEYDEGVIHSQGRTLVGPVALESSTPATAAWGYPSGPIPSQPTSPTLYNKNPRLGLLYSWDAVTAGKGGVYGVDNYTEGGNVASARIQGLCPKGWHVPSDAEFTRIANQILTYTSTFSSTPNIGGSIPYDYVGYEGDILNKALMEGCQMYKNKYQGTSNIINPAIRPGFDALLAGNTSGSVTGASNFFGTGGYFWTASGSGNNSWFRMMLQTAFPTGLGRNDGSRKNMYSLRCVKD